MISNLLPSVLGKVADLQAKIADSRRFAAYGEAKLNKWQRRSFSIR
ncbi:MAG: hypothetical protein ACKPBV_00280 [Sphaerospermopsis kisseleviana]